MPGISAVFGGQKNPLHFFWPNRTPKWPKGPNKTIAPAENDSLELSRIPRRFVPKTSQNMLFSNRSFLGREIMGTEKI